MTCELCGREASGYLCNRHREQLASRLAELPVLYTEVGECLVPRRGGWGEIVATRGAAGPRSPIDEDVLDTVTWGRAGEVVHLWRVDVQRERWPHHGPPPAADLSADARWLVMELEWIAEQYAAAGELAREVRELEGQARTIVGDPAPRPQHLGMCIAVTDDQGKICGAALSRLPGQTELRCRQCRCVYRGGQDLLLLRHYQPSQAA